MSIGEVSGMMSSLEKLRARHILVVEDEAFLAFDLAKKLCLLGAHVIGPASRVKRASELVTSSQPLDAALLEINLPSKSPKRTRAGR